MKTVATLLMLTVLLPINLTVTASALLMRFIGQFLPTNKARMVADQPKTILISGGKMTKALQLARSFRCAGHRVVMIEGHKYWLTAHRFSRAVDCFFTVPEASANGYAEALLAIVKRENVDIYIPVCSPASSLYDSLAMKLLAPYCGVVHVDEAQIETLDDKYKFAKAAQALGLRVPRSYLITDPAQVETFDFAKERRPLVLKSIKYDSVRRLDLTKLPLATPQETSAFARSLPISAENPWVMQEFIEGIEFCTHGTFINGELRVHCCCESSSFQVNYANVDKPAIAAWVRTFGQQLQLTGQASFDFIQAHDDGQAYAIECNPRTHSAVTMYYNHPDLATAYLGRSPQAGAIQPLASSKPTYWLYHEVWKLITGLGSLRTVKQALLTIWRGKDAVFDWQDPLPFFMLHHWHIPLLLLRDLKSQRGWIRIDFNIGKLVQAGGD